MCAVRKTLLNKKKNKVSVCFERKASLDKHGVLNLYFKKSSWDKNGVFNL